MAKFPLDAKKKKFTATDIYSSSFIILLWLQHMKNVKIFTASMEKFDMDEKKFNFFKPFEH